MKLGSMDNFTLKSPYFHLVLLFLCFTLSMSAMQLNPLKIPVTEIHEGLPYFFINNAG